MSASTVRTRFAPSPSGHLHVGGARTALFCFAYARGRDGRFVLRIEDTDQKRSSDSASMAFLEDLAWLGLRWDEGPEHDGCGGGDAGPYRQSERRAIYDGVIARLIEEGKAYRAFETPDELQAARASARAQGANYRYDRAALTLDQPTIERYLAEGRPHVVRLRVPDEEPVSFVDGVLGEITTPAGELDDFVICKADGYPTYHLAVVIDDELMGVTHVIRAQEHVNNTARHVLLQDALGYARPKYAHVSVILNPDGSKMSKRDRDKALRRAVKEKGLDAPPPAVDGSGPAVPDERWAWWIEKKEHQLDLDEAERLASAVGITLPEINVDDFRRHGYLPEVMVNYLALLGWSPGGDRETFDLAFFESAFDFDRLVKSAAKFDRDKLLSFNLAAIQALDADAWVARFTEHCRGYRREFIDGLGANFDLFARVNQARAKTLDDTLESCRFFLAADEDIVYADGKPVRKALINGDTPGLVHLEAVRPRLEALASWTVESIEEAVRSYADAAADGKLGKVAQPLRIAVSGGTVSPAIFETLAIIGQPAVLRRIDRCIEHGKALSAPAEAG